jgi:hypothetical protein
MRPIPSEDGDGRTDGSPPAPPPSARVRLEVAILDAVQAAPALEPSDERARRTVLVVAAEPDLRRYVRECLRDRADVRVIDAESIGAGLVLAAHDTPHLLVVDESEREILTAMPEILAILIVDDATNITAPEARLRLLGRPFRAEGLLAEVGRLLQ